MIINNKKRGKIGLLLAIGMVMKADGSIGRIAEKYGLDAEKTVSGGKQDEK